MDLTEAEDIKKRWQQYTEELYKTDRHDPVKHDGVITYLQSDTKGTLHAKIGSIKERNGMDLTEAEAIKKRWLEYTEDLYKKELHDPNNHYGVITHLELDILEVKSSGP